MNSKKEKEKEIFDLVYGQKNFNIEHEDKPDFWISNSNLKFGVEITELYHNESSARIQNIESYRTELLNDKNYRHKDDPKHIKVDNIDFLDKESGKLEFSQDAIIQDLPSIIDYRNLLSEAIKEKTRKSKKYNSELKYYELIINDVVGSLDLLGLDQFQRYLFSQEVIETILDSNFEEIYLISSLKSKKYFFPLKRMIFISKVFLFNEISIKIYPPEKEIEDRIYYQDLSEFLYYEGFKDLKIYEKKSEIQLIYANTGLKITPENSCQLLLDDWYIKPYVSKLEKNSNKFINNDNLKLIEKAKQDFFYYINMETEIT